MEKKRIKPDTLSKTKVDDKETEIRSQKYLRPEIRFRHHTAQVLYNALDIAEEQITELLEEVKELRGE